MGKYSDIRKSILLLWSIVCSLCPLYERQLFWLMLVRCDGRVQDYGFRPPAYVTLLVEFYSQEGLHFIVVPCPGILIRCVRVFRSTDKPIEVLLFELVSFLYIGVTEPRENTAPLPKWSIQRTRIGSVHAYICV